MGEGRPTSDSDYSKCIHMHKLRDLNCAGSGVHSLPAPSTPFPPKGHIWGLCDIDCRPWKKLTLAQPEADLWLTLGSPVLPACSGKGEWAGLGGSPLQGGRGAHEQT